MLLPYVLVSIEFLSVMLLFAPNDIITLPEMKKSQLNRENFFKRAFAGVDYYLLLTFMALFILIGNLEHISFFNSLFTRLIVGNELIWGVAASQVISNVSAAILLSGFSTNYEAIIIGINIGGFETLIVSMANLISFELPQL